MKMKARSSPFILLLRSGPESRSLSFGFSGGRGVDEERQECRERKREARDSFKPLTWAFR